MITFPYRDLGEKSFSDRMISRLQNEIVVFAGRHDFESSAWLELSTKPRLLHPCETDPRSLPTSDESSFANQKASISATDLIPEMILNERMGRLVA